MEQLELEDNKIIAGNQNDTRSDSAPSKIFAVHTPAQEYYGLGITGITTELRRITAADIRMTSIALTDTPGTYITSLRYT